MIYYIINELEKGGFSVEVTDGKSSVLSFANSFCEAQNIAYRISHESFRVDFPTQKTAWEMYMLKAAV